MSLESSIVSVLHKRAAALALARSFFASRHITEVDTPLLGMAAPIDEHIEIMEVDVDSSRKGFLHSSPEYAMKRLLVSGMGDIFQLGHVFRKGEISPLHNPEFTLVEWYRLLLSFPDFIEETIAFIRLFLGPLPTQHLSYAEAFLRYLHIDPFTCTRQELLDCAATQGINLAKQALWDTDDLLHMLLGTCIEPMLGNDHLLVLSAYPPSMAALASLSPDKAKGYPTADRFEIYYQGIELANGYRELLDPTEQQKRLENSCHKRQQQNKPSLPIDYPFLQALQKGLPPCCGVAVGFDRLLLLQEGKSSLQAILPFAWQPI